MAPLLLHGAERDRWMGRYGLRGSGKGKRYGPLLHTCRPESNSSARMWWRNRRHTTGHPLYSREAPFTRAQGHLLSYPSVGNMGCTRTSSATSRSERWPTRTLCATSWRLWRGPRLNCAFDVPPSVIYSLSRGLYPVLPTHLLVGVRNPRLTLSRPFF